ncbi:MAG: hypothetical protein ABL949_10410 [Fimbriimonadaceae bacterium]
MQRQIVVGFAVIGGAAACGCAGTSASDRAEATLYRAMCSSGISRKLPHPFRLTEVKDQSDYDTRLLFANVEFRPILTTFERRILQADIAALNKLSESLTLEIGKDGRCIVRFQY